MLAFTGPDVVTTRQGGWNQEHGFGHPHPNPVTQVEMLSTLTDGTEVSVQSEFNTEWVGLSALKLDNYRDFPAVADRLRSALATGVAPWQTRTVDVDGSPRDTLVMDLTSPDLPAGVTGPPLLAFVINDDYRLTVITDKSDIQLAFTEIPIEDLVPAADQ